jgi:hypothetical protein
MDYRTTCSVMAGSAAGPGILLLLAPVTLTSWFGLEGGGVHLLAVLVGGFLLALGGSLWGARGVTDVPTQRIVCVANGTCDAAIAVALVVAAWGGVVNGVGWVLAAVFALNVASWAAVLPR